ncbi:toxin glutamine deamidase domain-containing protein [Kitasatospora viridis]|uniref:Papain fold toxin 1 (Glutamine deamidase) of polymorphic toxin system n=1 Tax=Kitasatospora viridis TaxID=281105 RepID=A0A561UDB7_9ACTN|nr:toxin glutamine deamidase domain-containing protein [Kitasatospora viridis]TWF97351.1 papain fold toxin 1 (glutamine deamidase) of polymorphic toxin system [Kitasatospora viridis]
MGAKQDAEKVVRKITGMWWPDADEDGLRAAAKAWDALADAIDDVCGKANKEALGVAQNNTGKAVDAFEAFWGQYYKDGKGWLKDASDACRSMSKAFTEYADQVKKAKGKLEEEIALVGGVLVAGAVLAWFTAGLSEAAAASASASIVAAATALGVTVTEAVAEIASTVLVGAVFGAVESATVDLAVAQPIKMGFGDQNGISVTEVLDSAGTGALTGGAMGGASSGANVAVRAAGEAGSPALTDALSVLSDQMNTLGGRALIGGGMSAGQDYVFDDGKVKLMDVLSGAAGGMAGPRAPMERPTGLDAVRGPLLNGKPGGLRPIPDLYQQNLESALPRNPDGSFQVHPDPTTGWVSQQNGPGIFYPGRANNCADATRAFLETWYGNPRVAAGRTLDLGPDGRLDPAAPENNSVRNQSRWAGVPETVAGWNTDGYNRVARDLLAGGHGSSAAVGVFWPDGGGHAFAAVNYQGTIYWVDPQGNIVSNLPIHPGAGQVNYIPLGPDRKPLAHPEPR